MSNFQYSGLEAGDAETNGDGNYTLVNPGWIFYAGGMVPLPMGQPIPQDPNVIFLPFVPNQLPENEQLHRPEDQPGAPSSPAPERMDIPQINGSMEFISSPPQPIAIPLSYPMTMYSGQPVPELQPLAPPALLVEPHQLQHQQAWQPQPGQLIGFMNIPMYGPIGPENNCQPYIANIPIPMGQPVLQDPNVIFLPFAPNQLSENEQLQQSEDQPATYSSPAQARMDIPQFNENIQPCPQVQPLAPPAIQLQQYDQAWQPESEQLTGFMNSPMYGPNGPENNCQPYIATIPIPMSDFGLQYQSDPPPNFVPALNTPESSAPIPDPNRALPTYVGVEGLANGVPVLTSAAKQQPPINHLNVSSHRNSSSNQHSSGPIGGYPQSRFPEPRYRSYENFNSNRNFGRERRNSRGRSWDQTDRSPDRFCVFCLKNGETRKFAYSHVAHDENMIITCPILRNRICDICGLTEDFVHTINNCPVRNHIQREAKLAAKQIAQILDRLLVEARAAPSRKRIAGKYLMLNN